MKSRPIGRVRGASMTEFLIVAPVLLGLGGGTLQAGLAYHGKSILNYATFEAARTGATHHALEAPMLNELGIRLAPLMGGDGTAERAISAIVNSSNSVRNPLFTRLEIINPTLEAFEHYKTVSRESGEEVIPNSHLRHQHSRPGSEVSLQDANLLKIKVTHGLDIRVPGIGALVRAIMPSVDPANAVFYAQGKLPLTSVATVRMQSEVHGDSLVSMASPPSSGADDPTDATVTENDPISGAPPGEIDAAADEPSDAVADQAGGMVGTCDGDGSDPFLPTIDAYACEAQGDSGSIFADDNTGQSSPVPSEGDAGGAVC